jgi:hypothetical protein
LADIGGPVVPILPVLAAVFSAWLAWPELRPGVVHRCRAGADSFGMGLLDWIYRETDQMDKALPPTDEDRIEFDQLDSIVAIGLAAASSLIDAGKALERIKARQLFRFVMPTWDAYCTKRHGVTARRCDQIIQAYKVLIAFSDETSTPVQLLSERAVRQIVAMPPVEARSVLDEAAKSDGGITAGSIKKVVEGRRVKAGKVPRPTRIKVPGGVVEIAFNRKGAASGFDVVAALEAAVRILDSRRGEAA